MSNSRIAHKRIQTTTKGPSDIKFFPYLSGEQTPYNEANLRPKFSGTSKSTTAFDMARANQEGVSFVRRDCLETLRNTDIAPKQLIAISCGSASVYWLHPLATVLNLPFAMPSKVEFGVARLAVCAVTDAKPEEIMTKPLTDRVILPDKNQQAAYAKACKKYTTRYPKLKDLQQHTIFFGYFSP